jgi:hypothetical protein
VRVGGALFLLPLTTPLREISTIKPLGGTTDVQKRYEKPLDTLYECWGDLPGIAFGPRQSGEISKNPMPPFYFLAET